MMSAKARYYEQVNRDRKLATMWNQGYTTERIAKKLGYNHGSSVSHAARRLGLEPRYELKNPRRTEPKQTRGEAAQLARCEAAEKRQQGPAPKWYCCEVCGGRSPTPIHESHGAQAA